MKYYLTIMLLGAFGVMFISLSDLAVNDSIVDRMERLGRTSQTAQSMTLPNHVSVARVSYEEVLSNFETYAPDDADEIERIVMGEYGKLLLAKTRECERANDYIVAALSEAMKSSISSVQANQWMQTAEKFCY